MKLISWNVNGIRACITKGFEDRFRELDADIFCLQETKCQQGQVELELPGYHQYWIYDDAFAPLYRLAAQYGKPVAVHTGLTASGDAYLKYSHPSVMDEAATKFRDVQFVMCHFGEPWYTDAAAVLEKNPNVAADLSGILEGKIWDFPAFYRQQKYYIEQLKGWISYLDSYDRFLFGTDWPLANLEDYITFSKDIIPEKHWDAVFYENAVRI